MTEMNRRWVFPTVTASENKSIERIALTGQDTAHEIVGVDGSRRFGCRPTSGFRLAHTLNFNQNFQGSDAAAADASRPFSDAAPPVVTSQSIVTDCFPVHFQIREGEFGHGFVYRVKPTGDSNTAIYMDYCPTNTVDGAAGWRTVLISDHSSSHVLNTAKMDVVSMGKYVITLVQGKPSRVFYIDFDSSGSTFTHQIINGGPGVSPLVRNIGDTTPVFPRTGSFPTKYIPVGKLDASTSANPAGSSPNEGKPEFHKFSDADYSFAYYLHDSHTGRRTPLSEICSVATGTDTAITADRYIAFEVEVDTAKFDQIFLFRSVKLQSVGGTYTGSILHLDTIYDVGDANLTGNDFEGISNTTPSAAPYNASGVTVDIFKCFYQLEDISLAMQDIYMDKILCDEEIPYAGSGIAYDGSLIISDPQISTSNTVLSIDSRVSNVGEIRWSSLIERSPEIFPINNKFTPDVFQNRVIALAKAGDFAVGFSNDRIYHIRRNGMYISVDELHSGFGLAGREAFTEAGPLIYFVTSKGMKAVANNGQLDDVKALDNLLLEDWYTDLSSLRLSFDPYASCLFIHNPVKEQTVCMWFSTGRITEIHDTDFDDVRTGVWPSGFTRNSYDNTTPTTTTANSMNERSFFLQNHPDPSNPSSIPTGWRPRVYILDIDREKNAVNTTDLTASTDKVLRTLDCGGDSIFTVKSVTTASPNNTVILKSGLTTAKELGGENAEGTHAHDIAGAYAYVISSTDTSRIGKKFQILKASGGNVSVDGTYGGSGDRSFTTLRGNISASLVEGDVLAVSPVLFRYVGSTLPMTRTENKKVVTTFDMFANKQISSVGCHFTDVAGGITGYKFFRGLVYNTESNNPAVSAFPLDFAGSVIGDSIKTGESDDYAAFTNTSSVTRGKHGIQDSALNPGIESYCPDLDFKLMALICRGRATATDTGERNT